MGNLSIPLILKDGHFATASIEDSIICSIALILCTRIGQLPFAPDYGCSIWDREFTDLETSNKSDVRGSLRNAIEAHEKRLQDVAVAFSNVADGSPHILGLFVKVRGTYLADEEEHQFDASFRLG